MEKDVLNSEAAVQDLKSKEATEKLIALQFQGHSSGGIVSIADAVGFYKFNLGKVKHIKY